jgi:hypothetical protein
MTVVTPVAAMSTPAAVAVALEAAVMPKATTAAVMPEAAAAHAHAAATAATAVEAAAAETARRSVIGGNKNCRADRDGGNHGDDDFAEHDLISLVRCSSYEQGQAGGM